MHTKYKNYIIERLLRYNILLFLYVKTIKKQIIYIYMNKYMTIENSIYEYENIVEPPESKLHNSGSNEIMTKIKSFVDNYGKPIHLVILTPCYGGMTHVNYMICLMNTLDFFRNLGIIIHVEFCKNDSLITRARNNLIAKGMNNKNTTHLMFIDNDITWNPIEIAKLLISNKEVVGGVYPLKNYRWSALLENTNMSVAQNIQNRKNNSNILSHFDNEIILKSQLLKYNMNILTPELKIENNIAEIRHLPTGFMLIKREVIDAMILLYPETKYNDDIGFLNNDENVYAYALFDTGIMEGHYLSEDWLFCERWRKNNGHVYMDVSILLTHTGLEDYTGCFILSV